MTSARPWTDPPPMPPWEGEISPGVLAVIETLIHTDATTTAADPEPLRLWLARRGAWTLSQPAATTMDGWCREVAEVWHLENWREPVGWRPLARVVAAAVAGEQVDDRIILRAGVPERSCAA